MSSDLVFLFLFALAMSLFLWLRKGNVHIHWFLKPFLGMIMYKTTWGLRLMDRLGKWKGWRILIPIMNTIGVTGMLFIILYLILTLVKLFTGHVERAAALVLPVKSSFTFYVPFTYWIISIIIIASIHELAHGVLARHYGVRIRNSGFAFLHILLPIIPAAFVEPDEDEMKLLKGWKKIAILTAGPVSNLLLGGLLILLSIALTPLTTAVFQPTGVVVTNLTNYSALTNTSFQPGEKIAALAGQPVHTLDDLKRILENLIPGSRVTLKTNRTAYIITLLTPPDNRTGAWIGVQGLHTEYTPRKAYTHTPIPTLLTWFLTLISFLIILNIGIGLVNLLPIFIADGAHILSTLLTDVLHVDEETALRITGMTSTFLLIILLATLLLPSLL